MKEQLERANYLEIVACQVARNTVLIPSESTEVLVGKKVFIYILHLNFQFTRKIIKINK